MPGESETPAPPEAPDPRVQPKATDPRARPEAPDQLS